MHFAGEGGLGLGTMEWALLGSSMACWLGATLAGLARSRGERVHTWAGMMGSVLGITASLMVLGGITPPALQIPFWESTLVFAVDALSAAFLLPLFLMAGLATLYVKDYWPSQKRLGGHVRFFFGLLTFFLTLMFTVRQGLGFLVAWEGMALSAFFLVSTEHTKPDTQKTGWLYLVCTHTGTLMLIAMVVLLQQRLCGFTWTAHSLLHRTATDSAILLLAIGGFGFKAGIFPLHFWLPPAHAEAPSQVSAMLSGVMLKAGIYGLLRITCLVPPVPFLGPLLICLGTATALFGVVCALSQEDYKKLLAYSSVENIGIIFMGIGLGCIGRYTHHPALVALGFGGAIFHVWNHSLFKGLLFFSAGSVLHATHSRQLSALGGLARRMPKTALCMLPGILAVSALPPFNGFLSEWLLYRGFFACLTSGSAWLGSLALFAMALTAGFAAVAFAKCYGFMFLGHARSKAASTAQDPGLAMLSPMVLLASLCLLVSLGAMVLLPLLDRAIAVLHPNTAYSLAHGVGWDVSIISRLCLVLLLLAFGLWRWLQAAPRQSGTVPTWDCGYAKSTVRMQYTPSSFSDSWAGLFPMIRRRMRRIRALFPVEAHLETQFHDPVGDHLIARWGEAIEQRFLRYRKLQQGQLPIYQLYILLALLGVFLWMLLRPRLLG